MSLRKLDVITFHQTRTKLRVAGQFRQLPVVARDSLRLDEPIHLPKATKNK
jgi:hypothetical protein